MSDVLRPSAEDAVAAWAARVRANREQVEQFREVQDGADFYAPIATHFRAAPGRTDEPTVQVLQALVQPGETWLDIGAGGGRYALPLAEVAGQVIALDPSPGMLAQLGSAMEEYGVSNVRPLQARWPMPEPLATDVAFIANVGYDVEEMGAFLDAMERSARRLCAAMLFEQQPTRTYDVLWPEVHGVARAMLPALPELLTLLLARGRIFELRLVDRPPTVYDTFDEVLAFSRRQLWVRPGGEKDQRLQAVLRERAEERDGRFALAWAPGHHGIVTWKPR
jgi:SAM-dependent methyltransferase